MMQAGAANLITASKRELVSQMSEINKIVIVGGCGHVGLPLGIVFANAGIHISLLDVNTNSIAQVNSGRVPFMENGAESMLARVVGSKLHATADDSCLREAEAAI